MSAVAAPYDGVDWVRWIVVESQDKKTYRVSRAAARMSKYLNNLLEDQMEGTQTVIPVPNVDGATLERVAEYMEHHHQDPQATVIPRPLEQPLELLLSEWDKAFVCHKLVPEYTRGESCLLRSVCAAANFMVISELSNLMHACIASLCRDQTVDQLTTLFHITNPLTADQQRQWREKYRWVDEHCA